MSTAKARKKKNAQRNVRDHQNYINIRRGPPGTVADVIATVIEWLKSNEIANEKYWLFRQYGAEERGRLANDLPKSDLNGDYYALLDAVLALWRSRKNDGLPCAEIEAIYWMAKEGKVSELKSQWEWLRAKLTELSNSEIYEGPQSSRTTMPPRNFVGPKAPKAWRRQFGSERAMSETTFRRLIENGSIRTWGETSKRIWINQADVKKYTP